MSHRVLFLLPFAPRLDASHGGGRAIAQFVGLMAARHRVALLYLRAPGEPPLDESLRARCDASIEVWRSGPYGSGLRNASRLLRLFASSALQRRPMWAADWHVPAFGTRLREFAADWRPGIVQIEYHIMGQYLRALDACGAPRVLTEYEPGVAAALDKERMGSGPRRVACLVDRLAWERFERSVIERVNAVVVLTRRDRDALAALASTRMVEAPLGAMVPEKPSDPMGTGQDILFVGNFLHPPNVDAAMRLAQSVFPRVRARFPSSTLSIVGDAPPAALRRAAGAGVTIAGRVPDLSAWMARAAVVAAPLRSGGGMRVKVLEALSYGKALVASPLAIEGLALSPGRQFALAVTDDEFADALCRLLEDPRERASLATRARDWACANLSWQPRIDAYERLWDSLVIA